MILQEAETEGHVGIDAAQGSAHTRRELNRRSHCGTHAQADRGQPARPDPR